MLVGELLSELRKLMSVCSENLLHTQELQKWVHNKGVKSRCYTPGDKVWLNSKYIKTKQNRKLEPKFLGLFQILNLIGNQAYKLELLKKWKIHYILYVSLLKQDITRKERVEETQLELDVDNEEEYKVEAI